MPNVYFKIERAASHLNIIFIFHSCFAFKCHYYVLQQQEFKTQNESGTEDQRVSRLPKVTEENELVRNYLWATPICKGK